MPGTRPEKKCDVVMKGGVTSGVVYPKALSELSKFYQFVNIGGTSAGAIAAGVAAAAEYARAGGNAGAFEEVAGLPAWLGNTSPAGGHSNLFRLFQPQKKLAGLYGVVMSSLGKKGAGKVMAVVGRAVKEFPLFAILGTLPGVLSWWVASSAANEALRGGGYVLAMLIGVAGALLALAARMGSLALVIPKSRWGICTGMTESGAGQAPALVPWLAEFMDKVAGKSNGEPLTFGDLASRGINLQMISTNATTGRPYTLPFGKHTHYYFKAEELRKFFPENVVKWMEGHGGEVSSRDRHGEVKNDGLKVFPNAENLPVIVAVRMSLSFPFLFCPIPLHGVDFALGPKEESTGKRIPEPNYFVDGGLTSNFPLNLFDKPIPRWPTFGINLRDKDAGRHKQDIYMICGNDAGMEEWWTRFDKKQGAQGLFGYFGLLFDTARNWRDNLQISTPGYRDRVVHIGLDPTKEGGMNLDMPSKTIDTLTQRGEEAAGAILSRYCPTAAHPSEEGCVVSWRNQRWVRFRSFMAQLETALVSLGGTYVFDAGDEASYSEMLKEGEEPSYLMTDSQRSFAIEFLASLTALVPEAEKKQAMGQSFESGAPRPMPDLRVTPHF